jgi:hypothetical protein
MQTKGGKEDPRAKLLESPKEQEAAFRKYCLDLLEDRSPDVRIRRFPPTWP